MNVNYSIVPRRGHNEVLMVPGDDGWTLPGHSLPGAAEINADLKARFGVEVVFTGFVQQFVDDEHGFWYICAHENNSTSAPTGDAEWVGPDELAGLELAVPQQRDVLTEWFQETTDGVSPMGHLPWADPNWVTDVSRWVGEQPDITPTGPVEQLHSQPWSCVSRVPTTTGTVYLKAVPASLGHEPLLTRTVSRWFPEHLPEVVAINTARHWLLTRDIGPFEEYEATAEHAHRFEPVLRTVATMQRQTVDRVDDLVAAGCPDRRAAVLPGLLAELLDDKDQFLIDHDGGLSGADHARLVAWLPSFDAICARLDGDGVPDTLHHDDVGAGNIAFVGQRPVIFDWGESAVAHPFFSLRAFLRDVRDDAVRARLRDAYLSEWLDHGPMPRLVEAFDLTHAPSVLCRALSWRAALAALGDRRPFVYKYVMARAVRQLLPFTESEES